MTIDEAIEKLEEAAQNLMTPRHYKYVSAIKLGIEALKRCKYIRTHPSEPRVWELPGETKE